MKSIKLSVLTGFLAMLASTFSHVSLAQAPLSPGCQDVDGTEGLYLAWGTSEIFWAGDIYTLSAAEPWTVNEPTETSIEVGGVKVVSDGFPAVVQYEFPNTTSGEHVRGGVDMGNATLSITCVSTFQPRSIPVNGLAWLVLLVLGMFLVARSRMKNEAA